MDYSREQTRDSLEEFDADIYETVKDFGQTLLNFGYQQNIDKNIFLNKTKNDFTISGNLIEDFNAFICQLSFVLLIEYTLCRFE